MPTGTIFTVNSLIAIRSSSCVEDAKRKLRSSEQNSRGISINLLDDPILRLSNVVLS